MRWFLALMMALVAVGVRAEVQGGADNTQTLGAGLNALEPAAGPQTEPSLLDEKAEELKAAVRKSGTAEEADDGDGSTTDAVGKEVEKYVSLSGMRVLSGADAKAYKDAFARARRGQAPELSVKDKVLKGEVEGVYLLHKRGATFAELNGWLKDHRDMPLASAVYDLAQDRRARPKESCKTVHVKKKVHGKTKSVAQRKCTQVGSWGPEPVRTLAMEKKEAAKAARDTAREDALAKLPDEGRRALGESWKLRGRGKYAEATSVMLRAGVRPAVGNDFWQAELVRSADALHGKRDWKGVLRAAEPASGVAGAQRDDARWLAGYAHYMLGDKDEAAEQWDRLVRENPSNGPQTARAAWWGARVYGELGQQGKAKSLLELGAKDPVSFYGQLSAAKLGRKPRADFAVPAVGAGDFAQLTRVEAARRGLALAQIGEVDMAQKELRAAFEDLPYNATKTLAAVSMQMGLPATALYASKQLLDEGEVMLGALFPLAEDWQPQGGWRFDRALMLGIMRQESAFNPQIGSRVGAQGLMQLMPQTAKYIARLTGASVPERADLHDPATNLGLGQAYLRYLSDQLDGNMMLVVASYNGGIGNVRRWLNNGTTPGHDPMLWLENIPFDETRDYVEKVFANYWLYQQRMKQETWSLAALADGYWPLQWNGQRKTALRQ